MSDFLSKFNKDKYGDLVNELEKKKAGSEKGKQEESKSEKQPEKRQETQMENEAEKKHEKESSAAKAAEEFNNESEKFFSSTPTATPAYSRRDTEEEMEIDYEYRRKKRIRLWLAIGGAVLACILLFIIFHMSVHVKVEDFVGQPVSEARAWASENDIEIELNQEYSKEFDPNQIISQSVEPGDKVKKGNTLELTTSLGADPEELIELPDFSKMNQEEARSWIEENKADNMQIVTEYSEDVEKGGFIRFTIRDNDVSESEYQRKHSAVLYYSKGEEVFEKNIVVPDFTNQPKEEVEKWVKANEIEMTYKEEDSDTVEAGFIIKQSIAPDEKVAKRDEMEVVVSLGKATVVPNFAEMTAEEALANYPDLNLFIKERYHASVPYGRLISQSVEAGTKLTEQDDKNITVTYSLGKPYLGDFRGYLEGDLPRLFFDEYQSKGADIKYIVKYVDAPEVKGTVVGASKFNEFVPLTFTVEIRVSNNTSAPASPPDNFEEEPELPVDDEDFEVNGK